MHDHWIPRWVEGLPWWVKWGLMGGAGILSAFLPGVVAPNWQVLGASVGAALFGVACIGATWHGINDIREHRGRPRLKLEPNYLIIFGLAVAIIGFAWQSYRNAAGSQATKPTIAPSVVQLPKNYFPAEKVELGNLLSLILTHLNKEGLDAANEASLVSKPPEGLLKREALIQLQIKAGTARNLVQILSEALFQDVLEKNPKFNFELTQVIGSNSGSNLPLGRFEQVVNAYHDDTVIFLAQFEQLSSQTRQWLTNELFRRDAQALAEANKGFRTWIQECSERVNSYREALR